VAAPAVVVAATTTPAADAEDTVDFDVRDSGGGGGGGGAVVPVEREGCGGGGGGGTPCARATVARATPTDDGGIAATVALVGVVGVGDDDNVSVAFG
jgi:hypothetical protein